MKRLSLLLFIAFIFSGLSAQKVELGIVGNLSKMQSKSYYGALPSFSYPSQNDLSIAGRLGVNLTKHSSLEFTGGYAAYGNPQPDYYNWYFCCFRCGYPDYISERVKVLRFETNYRFTFLAKARVKPYLTAGFTHDLNLPEAKQKDPVILPENSNSFSVIHDMQYDRRGLDYAIAATVKPGVRTTIARRFSIDVEALLRYYVVGSKGGSDRVNHGLQLGFNYSI